MLVVWTMLFIEKIDQLPLGNFTTDKNWRNVWSSARLNLQNNVLFQCKYMFIFLLNFSSIHYAKSELQPELQTLVSGCVFNKMRTFKLMQWSESVIKKNSLRNKIGVNYWIVTETHLLVRPVAILCVLPATPCYWLLIDSTFQGHLEWTVNANIANDVHIP